MAVGARDRPPFSGRPVGGAGSDGWIPPRVFDSLSPNYGPARPKTVGIIIHGTHGGADTLEREFAGTLNWFGNVASAVSAHDVIGPAGEIARVVPDHLIAWHAGALNTSYIGIEVVHRHPLESVPEPTFRSLVWAIKKYAVRYGFPLINATTPYHSETSQGVSIGKVDLFPRGSSEGKAFRAKIRAALGIS